MEIQVFDIAAWRKRLGLTQEQAAEAIGRSKRQFINLEQGTTPVSRGIAAACQLYEMSLTTTRATALDYTADEEHLLRRLGGAVIALWGAMPETLQSILLDQATYMADRHETVQLREQLERFVRIQSGKATT
jgi:transcriptional regulator with XRE-family HTH domain